MLEGIADQDGAPLPVDEPDPAGQAVQDDAGEAVDVDEDELEPVDPEQLEIDRMAEILGPMYEDGWDAAIELMQKQHVEYPKDERRRGRQMALALRELGWEDDAILAYVGLTVGVTSDLAYIQRLPDRETNDEEANDDA
jgi:hypothetical protein